MNVLVITDVLWRNDNGVGNSYTNIFGGMRDVVIANICCQTGKSQNDISTACFQISERNIIANLKNKSVPSGMIENINILKSNESIDSKMSGIIKRMRLQIFFWIRDAIWKTGKWKSKELNEFIDNFKPDVIFAQLQDKMYQNRLVSYVQQYTNKPLILYVWDDVYSLKQFRFSPLFWIDRFLQRCSIRGLMKQCSLLYTISCEQQEEYRKKFHVKTGLLYKGADFEKSPSNSGVSKPIKILYTGNLYSGRYKTIKKFCECLSNINKDKQHAFLEIYSATPLSNRCIKMLNIDGSSSFKGKTGEKEVQKLQNNADILLHIEPMSLRGSLTCRLSFSTKLVDYFHKKKCIFAVGSSRCSSMKYLKRFDAAVVSESYNDMAIKLKDILNNESLINEYAKKAWSCGEQNHRISNIQKKLYSDMMQIQNNS